MRIHAFFTTDPDKRPSKNTEINVLTDIINLGDMTRRFGNLLSDILRKMENMVSHSISAVLQEFKSLVSDFEHFLLGIISSGSLQVQNVTNSVQHIWERYISVFKRKSQEVIDSLKFNETIVSRNLTELIKFERSKIVQNIEKIIDKVRVQVFSVVTKYTGFGMRFSADMFLMKLGFGKLDIELLHSVHHLGKCSKFKKVYELLKGEHATKLLLRVTRRKQLGYFVTIEKSESGSMALSSSMYKFVFHIHAHVAALGMTVSGDLLISNNGIEIFLEGNIWNVYFARLTFSAATGKEWYDLTFQVKGELVVKSGENDFGGSYLDGLRMLLRKVSDEAGKRLDVAKDRLTSVQKGITMAQEKLTQAQQVVRKCNSAFDYAIRSLETAKQKLEEAKRPFIRAEEKVRNAQRHLDRLCKIRTCHGICVPGFRMTLCKGWIPYPCFKRTSCMFKLPNAGCYLANLVCRALRAIAYIALEAAKIFLRIPMLVLDAAKLLVSAVQFVVDKSRVVLLIAEGVLEVAKLGLEVVKTAIDVAKLAIEGVKFILRAALYILDLIIKYGLQNLLDVRNCKFNVELSTTDKAEFGISCEVKAFGLRWRKFGFEFDFRHPIMSMLKVAKSTVDAIIDLVKDIFGKRRRRDIQLSYETMQRLHHAMHIFKRNADKSTENMDDNFNETMNEMENDTDINLSSQYKDRIEYFKFNCKKFLHAHLFLNESIDLLRALTDESVSALNDSSNTTDILNAMNINITADNFTTDSLGISPETAVNYFNITEDEIQDVLDDVKNSTFTDPQFIEMTNSTTSAKETLDTELESSHTIMIIDHWMLGMENITKDFYAETECVGFEDCIMLAFSELYDVFIEKNERNSSISRTITTNLEQEFMNIIMNRSLTIPDALQAARQIQASLEQLDTSNVFCSVAPDINNTLRSLTVLAGASVEIECNASGIPQPTITWYHNGVTLNGHVMDRIVLSDIKSNDGGVYSCEAANVVINVSRNVVNITVVECPPGTAFRNASCTECDPGFYQPEWNKQMCDKCNEGYASHKKGAKAKIDCIKNNVPVIITAVVVSSLTVFVGIVIVICKWFHRKGKNRFSSDSVMMADMTPKPFQKQQISSTPKTV